MKRILTALLAAFLSWSAAQAGSTIDPNSPGPSSNLTSATLRSNFLAAYTDINNILGCYARATPPVSPVNLQSWCDTSGSPNYVFKYRNSQTNAWVPYGTLNVNTGVWTPYGSAAGFLATAPISVSVSSGVVTYSLLTDANFAVNGSSQLALANAASGTLLGNCTGGSAEPGACTWNNYANVAVGASDGMIPYHAGGSWTTILTGTSGATIPRLDTANTWSLAQTIPNAVLTGTTTLSAANFSGNVSISGGTFTATGLVGLGNLATQAANTVLVNSTAGAASPIAQAVPSCVSGANALQWTTNTGISCGVIAAASLSGQVPIAGGGTGQTSAAAAIIALMPTPTRAGDIAYWNGTNWTTLAGNNSGTLTLQENASGVPVWASVAGTGTVNTAGVGLTLTGGGSTLGLSAARQTNPSGCAINATVTVTCADGSAGANNGTYTTPANALWLEIELIGGGSGGCGSGTTPGTGGAGGNTTLGTLTATGASACGGSGGGSGGVPTGVAAFMLKTGGSGGAGSGASQSQGGVGCVSPYGGNGAGGAAGAGTGAAATANTGSGGGGGGVSTTANGGGGGGCGGFIRAIFPSPAATYGYAIGAAGTAGTLGTGGAPGGLGGSGYIQITPHFN